MWVSYRLVTDPLAMQKATIIALIKAKKECVLQISFYFIN